MRATTEDDDDTHSPKSHIESRPYIPVGSFVIKWNKVAMIMSGFMKLKYCTLVGHMVETSVVTCSLGRACTRGAVSRGLKRMAPEKGIIFFNPTDARRVAAPPRIGEWSWVRFPG